MSDKTGTLGNSRFEIDSSDHSVQSLMPASALERFEGIAFSSSGNTIGVATADANTVLLFRRKTNGLFEDTPYWRITGSKSGLSYPHDVAFSASGDTELLAVAQRGGAVTIYEKNRANDNYGSDPVAEIRGPKAKLDYSDGVAFVPPNNNYLAACNLKSDSVCFYRRASRSPIGFDPEPVYELKHWSISYPDGLGFSRCGTWLAITNHRNHSVSIFQRLNRILCAGKLIYWPRPVTIIRDPGLRHPHSVAFTPETNHLVVTNAGANYFSVYEPERRNFKMRWSQSPVVQKTVGPEHLFKEVNVRNKMEGGPKGVAIHRSSLAICSPEHGVKIYSFRERPLRTLN